MTSPDDMTDDQLYAEIATWPSASDAPSEALAAVEFNSSPDLQTTNPERLLGLTPAQMIALVEANGACQGTRHALQIAANRSGGGWGEILRSPHCLDWFSWFVDSIEGVPGEVRAMARVTHHAHMLNNRLEDATMGRLMGERNYQMKVISAAKFEAIHEAQRRLMDHWSEQHRLLPVEMYQELSRLSNKLASAYLQSTSPTAELSYLMENERPAIQDYLRAMKRARDNEAASQELANRRYNLERNNERETLEGRMFDLQESLAQYLIACTARIEPLPDKEAMNEFLDSLTADA